ncbi:putative DNA glycosylase [Cardamine amara subsp. amara]|uniref:DNA glycosylase n=1 Tax=Cardamine amara subsp. amara TaxID=228776 RepID=A0ABD0Z1V7_CARAN
MSKAQKRKRLHQDDGDSNKSTVDGGDPYPELLRPTAEECRDVRDVLLSLHGFPPEFANYRRQRLRSFSAVDGNDTQCTVKYKPLDEAAEESVLDGLVKILLSQNTTEVNSQRAFASLKASFPKWEDVLAAEPKSIENAIRCGGLAPKKAVCIKNILNRLQNERGRLCLEYLRGLSIEEVKTELSHFKGVGPKTVSCVLMFNLQHNDFPVDTHVFEIAKALGWVPKTADRNKTYAHLNRRIPDELKFDLNCLLYTHGKLCSNCKKNVAKPKPKAKAKAASPDHCPLLGFSV